MFGIGDDGNSAQIRNDVPQHLQALAVELGCHECHAGHISARPGETVSEACRNRVTAKNIDDGHRKPEVADLGDGCALRNNEVDGKLHQFRCEFGHALNCIVAVAILNRQVTALDIAKIGKPGAHRGKVGCQARRLLRGQPTDTGGLRGALRGKTARQGSKGNRRDQKRSPFHIMTSRRENQARSVSARFRRYQ